MLLPAKAKLSVYFCTLTMSSDVTTWDSSCKHDSPLAAPSVLRDLKDINPINPINPNPFHPCSELN